MDRHEKLTIVNDEYRVMNQKWKEKRNIRVRKPTSECKCQGELILKCNTTVKVFENAIHIPLDRKIGTTNNDGFCV